VVAATVQVRRERDIPRGAPQGALGVFLFRRGGLDHGRPTVGVAVLRLAELSIRPGNPSGTLETCYPIADYTYCPDVPSPTPFGHLAFSSLRAR
jgi:hypothetical protein